MLQDVNVISNANCEECTIEIPDRETGTIFSKYLMEHKVQSEDKKDGIQFRHQFKKDKDGIISEQIMREGAGYITTEKEKKVNDEKMKMMNEKMEKMFLNSVNIKKKKNDQKEQLKEYFDDPETIKITVKKLAELIKNAKYCVVYTGAGISTSAKLPDYRGPNGTQLL
jgi:hypothetical protein